MKNILKDTWEGKWEIKTLKRDMEVSQATLEDTYNLSTNLDIAPPLYLLLMDIHMGYVQNRT